MGKCTVDFGWTRRGGSAFRLAGLGLALVLAGCAEEEPETLGYVETLGDDTLVVETFTHTVTGVEGWILDRRPVTRLGHYQASLNVDGTIGRLEMEWSTPPENPEGPEPERWVATIGEDSTLVERFGGEGAQPIRVAAGRASIPKIRPAALSYMVLNQAVRQARAAGEDPYELTLVRPGSPQPMTNAIVRRGSGEVEFDFFGAPMVAELDEEGRVTSVDGAGTTFKIRASRTASPPDVQALASEYAARDARGEGMGVPSPGDEVQVSAAGANFEIVYSRPAMRGREIWGGLVPYGEVWRTGANAATAFSTDRDVRIGDADVPAGSYTLWSVLTPDSALLIINEQTGQWGTQYDPGQDLARVGLELEELEEPVERFTMDIRPTGAGGILSLAWDRRRFSVPITVR